MSKLHVVLNGTRSLAKLPVYGRKQEVTPFIGVMERDEGSHERGVGVKCPDQEKLVFCVSDSYDPLVYLRALKMLSEIWEINDSLVQDCIIATKNEYQLENFLQTSVYKKGISQKRAMFYDLQSWALKWNPDQHTIQQVIKGFSLYEPLFEKELSVIHHEEVAPSCSVLYLAQPPKMHALKDEVCYLDLEHTLKPRGFTTESSGT